MLPDTEGFLAPQIDEMSCTDCGLCKRICPSNSHYPKDHFYEAPSKVYAAWNQDETIRSQSSSGGVFTALAEMTLAEGGIVIGSAFDEKLNVRHISIDTKSDLGRLRGSKYVQSEMPPDLYKEIRYHARNNRKILFSGTPCQVAGVRQFVKQQENILFVDILCHGVPSPLLWREYQKTLPQGITSFSFRDKTHGWKKFGVQFSFKGKVSTQTAWRNTYMKAFLQDMALRPVCYDCQYARVPRVGDISLADFWGVEKSHPEYDDDKGTSLVMANNAKGSVALSNCRTLISHQVNISDALSGNKILSAPSRRASQRDAFYVSLQERGYPWVAKAFSLNYPSLSEKVFRKIRSKLQALFDKMKIAK